MSPQDLIPAPGVAISQADTQELLTVYLGKQIFGIPILQVHDVLGLQKMTIIPLAPAAIAGSLNLRGRIVTAIQVRECLGLQPADPSIHPMSVVVEHGGESYSLMFDRVGDVMKLSTSQYESSPSTLDPHFLDVADGIYRLDNQLLVVLDIPKMLDGIGVTTPYQAA
jgi:purine-binding chemotaxis protein CheW